MLEDLLKTMLPWLASGGGLAAIVAAVHQWRSDRRTGVSSEMEVIERLRQYAAADIETARAEVASVRAEVAALRDRIEQLEAAERSSAQYIGLLLRHIEYLTRIIRRHAPDVQLDPVPTRGDRP